MVTGDCMSGTIEMGRYFLILHVYTNYIILHVFLYNIPPPRFGLSKCSVSCSLPLSFSFHIV